MLFVPLTCLQVSVFMRCCHWVAAMGEGMVPLEEHGIEGANNPRPPPNPRQRCGIQSSLNKQHGNEFGANMKVQINYGDIDHSDAISSHATDCVEAAMTHFVKKVTRVEVHLRDDKQNRTGPDDLRCMMEVRLAGEQPMTVDARGGDIYAVIKVCADKLNRAVKRKLERSA